MQVVSGVKVLLARAEVAFSSGRACARSTGDESDRRMSDLFSDERSPYGCDGDPVDVLVRDGVIADRGQSGSVVVETFDGQGDLVLPGLVDAHAHVDGTLWSQPWRPHSAGAGLANLIENERRYRPVLGPSR